MATLITICGTVMGFIGAVLGYFFADLGLFSALALWAFSGPLSAVLGAVMSMATDPQDSFSDAGHAEAA